jgi:hypothetical protein
MKRWTLWLFGGAALVAGLAACPQFAPDDVCGYPGFRGDSSAGEGGQDSGLDAPPGCDLTKDPKDSTACVDSGVGVFVDSFKSDNNDGSKVNPVATIAKGLSLAKQKGLPRVYVCEGTYGEDIRVDASLDGISIYGGWSCNDWSYSGNKPTVGATNVAAQLSSLALGMTIEDVAFVAADGSNAGDSSIAMLMNGSQNVLLARVSLTAGKGAKGADGTLTNYTFPASLNGNNADGVDGGAAKTVPCPAGDTSVGGKGGDVPGNRNGDNGQPALGGGDGGQGGSGSCSNGGNGLAGADGDAGAGASASGTLITAWSPSAGNAGGAGGVGQGGGGGGANFISAGQQGGGGSGGAGGCGGAGGGGGEGGGSSFGLAVVDSTVTISSSTIATQNAGDGGNGVAGQGAQSPGGTPGQDLQAYGCKGGFGGAGGSGGAGGGGAGGLSVGVFYKGQVPNIDSATTNAIVVGVKGAGGSGGAGNNGVAGSAQGILECKAPFCN